MEEQNISSPSELKETPKNTVPPKAEEKLSEAQQGNIKYKPIRHKHPML
ncbi:MAG: hypothetical protein HWD61_01700 [Parachlamydiaceae bacterium]|nr:MAG: hypothetical protein HWD61_01700 [Parachlamydiaceae bacterium]